MLYSYEWYQWNNVTESFLNGVITNNKIPRDIKNQMSSICGLSKNGVELSHKQKWFVVMNLIEHWDQLSFKTKSILMGVDLKDMVLVLQLMKVMFLEKRVIEYLTLTYSLVTTKLKLV